MSEYQYYEFQAIDRPLDERERRELRTCSTRATITSTRFTNHYEWGDLKGDPRVWMERYFDAFLYVANWGTHWLMLRFPRRLLDLRSAKTYCRGESATATAKGDFVILSFRSEDESGHGWDDDGTGWLSSLIPLRADIAAGDYRTLYLAWLLCVQEGAIPPHAAEPAIPPGLGRLTAPHRAFADFMRIDGDLLAVAGERSADITSGKKLDRWVAALPDETKTDLLKRFAAGDSHAARADLLRCLPGDPIRSRSVTSRTTRQLLDAAKLHAVERQRREAARAAAERVRRERAEVARREMYLVRLAKREAQTWHHVDALVATRKQSDYDEAVRLLKPEAWRAFAALRNSTLKVARAWALKEMAADLWECHYVGAARRFFRRWYFWAAHSRLQPMIEKARMLKTHLENILMYLHHRITNATAEGLNSQIQWIRYTARGFRNRENFKTAIYFHCGGLDLCPH